jgi:hypothetical protein
MNMKTCKATLLLALLFSGPALAGSGTVNYNSSGSSPFVTTTTGGGNNMGAHTIWDYSAGANGLGIDTNHAALIEGVSGGTPVPVTAASSGAITNPTSTLTLPSTTTAYGQSTLMATSATAGSVVVPSFSIPNSAGGAIIPRVRLAINDATSTAWGSQTIRVDLWSAAPTWTNGDRGAWSPATNTGGHLAAYGCVMSAEYGDGVYGECAPLVGSSATIKLASGTTVYWSANAVTGSGVTGASKTVTLTVEELN